MILSVIKVDISGWNTKDIPVDSALNLNDLNGYEGTDFSKYRYFGDCKTTVDKDHMWDATQMGNWVASCGLIPTIDILDRISDGDRKIPVKFKKTIEKLKKGNKLGDLSEIVCGQDSYQKIMFIYLSETDTHYFFDCER